MSHKRIGHRKCSKRKYSQISKKPLGKSNALQCMCIRVLNIDQPSDEFTIDKFVLQCIYIRLSYIDQPSDGFTIH